MIEPAHVLLIGDDPMSRHDQVDVLRHFWSVATSDTRNFERLLAANHVAVLCHSLSDQERENAIEAVRLLNREQPRMLLVKINGYDSGPHAGMDASVDLMHGPGALVSTIYQLITERGLPSRRWPLDEGVPEVQ